MKNEHPTVIRRSAGTATKPATTPSGPVSAFQMAPPREKKKRIVTPPVDPEAVVIETVPLPPKTVGRGAVSRYEVLFKRMKPGDVAWMPSVASAHSFRSWLRKAGHQSEVRTLDGRCGVWLLSVSRGTPAASKSAGR